MELLELCQSASACRGVIGKLSTEEKNQILASQKEIVDGELL